jgi:hypothetical protein
MTHVYVNYEDPDGGERWAIWSTIVEDWIIYDTTPEGLAEYEAEQAAAEARESVYDKVDAIQNGEDPYPIMGPDDADLERLQDAHKNNE